MAGKGSKPRPVDRAKWDSCPLWRRDIRDAHRHYEMTRQKREFEAKCEAMRALRDKQLTRDESQLHEQIETAKVEYDERDA